jgi:hypothetical protein
LSVKSKGIPYFTRRINPINQIADPSKEYIEEFTMAWIATRLASFLASVALFAVLPASAFSGSFEVSDLLVDSPFEANETSTANSTISCMFYPLSITLLYSLYLGASLSEPPLSPFPPLRRSSMALANKPFYFSHLLG